MKDTKNNLSPMNWYITWRELIRPQIADPFRRQIGFDIGRRVEDEGLADFIPLIQEQLYEDEDQ